MTNFSTFKFAGAALLAVAAAGAASADFLAKTSSPTLRFNRQGQTSQAMVQTRAKYAPIAKEGTKSAALREAASGVELIGSVIYSTDLETRPTGAYNITLGGEAAQWELLNGDVVASMGATLSGTTYYVSYQTLVDGFVYDWLDSYDIRTWELIEHKESNITMQASGDMAANPLTGEVYGCFYDESGSGANFAKVDFENLVSTQIARLYAPWVACAFDADGTLYCIDGFGALNTVDLQTGECELIQYTPVSTMYPASAAIDPSTHTMYCTTAPETGEGLLYAIDLSNGDTELIETFPFCEEVVGLAIKMEVDAQAPSKVKDLELNFPKGALEGDVLFTAPATMATGDKGTGSLEYVISVDGVETLTGSMNWGESVETKVNVATTGKHTIGVVARCGDHVGQLNQAVQYFGNDTPLAPEVFAERVGDNNVISWTLPLDGVNKGYIDPSAVTYTVTRLNDNTVVAEGLSEKTFSDPVPETAEIIEYAYSVTATFDGRTSEPGVSSPMYIGHVDLPFSETFDNASSLNGWTVVDHNDDTITWMWKDLDGGVVRVNYRNKYVMDDYLFTPALPMEAGKAYRLTFDVDSHQAGTTERIEVFLATGNTVDDIVATLVEPTDIVYTPEYQTMSCVIIPETTGQHFVAFHGISEPGQYYLKLDNVSVSDALETGLPAAVSDLTVTADYNGELAAHISFMAPTTDVADQPLAELTHIDIKRGSDVIETIDNPSGLCEFDDEDFPQPGYYTYTVVGYNSFGEGLAATARVYVGVNKPSVISNLQISEPSEGTVELTWDAPETDVDGQPINPSLITYCIADVVSGSPIVVQDEVTETSCTLTPSFPNGQGFACYAVFAVTDGGMSDGISSRVIPVGTPYELPFFESFPNGALQHDLALSWNDPTHKGQWMTLTEEDLEGTGVFSYDDDNGIIGMTGSAIDCEATFWTGKIALTQGAKLSFQVYKMNIDNTPNWNYVNIDIKCDGETTNLEEMVCVDDIEGPDNDWAEATFDLGGFAGKTVQIGITCCVQVYQWTFFDDFRVYEDVTGLDEALRDNSEADTDDKAEYFDLLGRPASPDASGFLLKRSNGRTTKVLR